MCGIVGYVGKRDAKNILIEGLLKLEYRGYDSAGFAVLNKNNELEFLKSKGRVKNLVNDEEFNNVLGNLGIAHTRWATHGEPSTINSHPHLDVEGKIAVVEQNHKKLKNGQKKTLLKRSFLYY